MSDDEVNAPAAAVYEGHIGGIIATLEGLLEKAEAQLDTAVLADLDKTRGETEMLETTKTLDI